MDSVIEHQRNCHEEIERIEEAIVKQFRHPVKQQKEKVARDHVVFDYLNKISQLSQSLLDSYNDPDGSRKEEIDTLSGPNEFSEFYKRLKTIKEIHRKSPNEMAEPVEMQYMNTELIREKKITEIETLFTGEESFGKFLDLNINFEEYLNLKLQPLDYLAYLDAFDNFEDVSKDRKLSADYRKYLDNLAAYLEGFIKRSNPLFDVEKTLKEIQEKFESEWASGSVPGWNDNTFYCTACDKVFSKQTVYEAHLASKKHQKAQEKFNLQKGPSLPNEKESGKDKLTASIEYRINKLTEILKDQREDTKLNVERKQSRTLMERELDIGEAEMDVDESGSEDDEKPFYNPLKIPLGWDGKPIPYWLYKLHGLGVEYKCEICGGQVYMGRKAFEKHFTEWKHSQGMRSLGIPNTKYFAEVTSIEEAKRLYEKMTKDKESVTFKPDQEEEYEDTEGNVFNKKTYEDLKREGLI